VAVSPDGESPPDDEPHYPPRDTESVVRDAVHRAARETVAREVPAIAASVFREFVESAAFKEMVVSTAISTVEANPGPFTEAGFVYRMAARLRRNGFGLYAAVDGAREAFGEFLTEAKIKFGDPAYSWSASAADELADEMVLRHCEPA
jgi:hypothetical protein